MEAKTSINFNSHHNHKHIRAHLFYFALAIDENHSVSEAKKETNRMQSQKIHVASAVDRAEKTSTPRANAQFFISHRTTWLC